MKAFAMRGLEPGIGLLAFAALASAPLAIWILDAPFVLGLLTRLTILAIAAASLNLILGYGGMISFGHAAYIGIGAYCVGIPSYYGVQNGLAHLALAVGCGALVALATGAISLRAKGVHFIMITMAFAQMLYFAFVSIEEYGGDDGLLILERSDFGFLDLGNNLTLFYICLATLAVTMILIARLAESRFGMAIRAARSNERRTRALGIPTYRYRLACYVLAGAICSCAGVLYANHSDFISPDAMSWIRSGELIFMVVLGGVARPFGPLFGVAAFILLEEYLPGIVDAVAGGYGEYWHLVFGVFLVFAVLFVRGGISGLLRGEGGKG